MGLGTSPYLVVRSAVPTGALPIVCDQPTPRAARSRLGSGQTDPRGRDRSVKGGTMPVTIRTMAVTIRTMPVETLIFEAVAPHRLEDENLDCQIGIDVVAAHERHHSASGELLH